MKRLIRPGLTQPLLQNMPGFCVLVDTWSISSSGPEWFGKKTLPGKIFCCFTGMHKSIGRPGNRHCYSKYTPFLPLRGGDWHILEPEREPKINAEAKMAQGVFLLTNNVSRPAVGPTQPRIKGDTANSFPARRYPENVDLIISKNLSVSSTKINSEHNVKSTLHFSVVFLYFL